MHTPHAHIQRSVAQQQRKWRNIFWAVLAGFILFQALDLWATEPPKTQDNCQASELSSAQAFAIEYDKPHAHWARISNTEPSQFSF